MELSKEVKQHIEILGEILDNLGERVEGNLICDITPDNIVIEHNQAKIENLINLAKSKKKICEIGVNAAHSLLLMVSSNPHAEYLVFDLGGHSYTKPCVEYIKRAYPDTVIHEVYGDSNITLPNHPKNHDFDLIHIDGGHETPTVINDFTQTRDMLTKDGIVVFDDYNYGNIREFIDSQVEAGTISRVTEGVIETDLHYVYRFND